MKVVLKKRENVEYESEGLETEITSFIPEYIIYYHL